MVVTLRSPKAGHNEINLVKSKGTTVVKVLPSNFEKLKKQFLSDVCSTVVMEDIAEELIINWDQTGLKYVLVSNWIFADKGSKQVEIAGLDDKRQLTVLLSCTMKVNCFPCKSFMPAKHQLVYPKSTIPMIGIIKYGST